MHDFESEAGRRKLVQKARSLLTQVDAGERPGIRPEVVEAARVIDRNGDEFPPEVRDAVRKVSRMTMDGEPGDTAPHIERVREIHRESNEAVDNAASVLAEFGEGNG